MLYNKQIRGNTMKTFFSALLIITQPVFCMAEAVILKDGAKFEAIKIIEDGDKLSIQTKYGSVFANKTDVENLEALGFANKSPVRGPKTNGLEFVSELLPDESVQVQYYFNREKVGTQLFAQSGSLLSSDGKIMDGTYKEFYPDGKLKKEKTVIGGEGNGSFKTFYPDGTLQSEISFVNGKRNGGYNVYSDSGKLVMEANYINGVSNGYFRQFDESGALKSQIQYENGEPKLLVSTTPQYELAPEYKSEQNENHAGMAGKEKSIFIEGEYFTVGGADKEWKKNLDVIINWAKANFYYANGDLTSYPGMGVTVGVNMGSYESSPVYLAASYVKGPSADGNGNIVDFSARSGNYTEELTTSFYRLLVGYKLVMPIQSTQSSFIIDVNAGFGGGSINSDWAYSGAAFIPTSGSSSESWTGFTWSVGPTISWEYPDYVFELGGRYTVFPELKDGVDFSDVKWKPLSIRAGVRF